MKAGWCSSCHRWRVLVRLQDCGCGQDHHNIGQFGNCSIPIPRWVIRRHDCGRRIPPARIRDLEGI